MKKLMVAAAIVCAAAVSQAAQCKWSTTAKAGSIADSTVKEGLSAGTYDASIAANADTMSNQVTSYGAAWAYELILDNGQTTKTFSGTPGFSSRAISVLLDDDFIVAGKDYTYTINLTGSLTDGKDATWDLASNTISGSFTAAAQGDITLKTSGPSSWTVTPEPTSALLLLLGVAGLALKRKQA